MKNAVSYYRVSSKEQVEEGNSLVTQENKCEERAGTTGYIIIKSFRDEGESAKTANRPGLQELLEYCRRNYREIDTFFFYKIDRLARSTEDFTVMRTLFIKLGIRMVSICEQIEDTPTGKFIGTVIAASAELDNETRAMICKGGMVTAVEEGRWVWLAPIGYRNGKINGKANLVPFPEEARFILRIFELIDQEIYSGDEIRLLVEQEGFRTSNGSPISRNYFYKLVRNPIYMGKIKAFGRLINGSFEPIVSPELFYRVQTVLDGKPTNIPKYFKLHPDFPLRGTLRCELCSRRLTAGASTGRKGKKYGSYHCNYCDGKRNNRNDTRAHELFASFLAKHRYSPELSSLIRSTIEFNWDERNKDAISESKRVSTALEEAKTEQKELMRRDLRGAYSNREMVNEMIREYDAKIAALTKKKVELRSIEEGVTEIVAQGTRFMEQVDSEWLYAEPAMKQRFQTFFFPDGLVYDRDEKFRTTSPLLLFELKKTLREEKSLLVDQRFEFWNRLITEMKQLQSIINQNSNTAAYRLVAITNGS